MSHQGTCHICHIKETEGLCFGCNINSFHATGLFLYPLKTQRNTRFSDIFRGYRRRPEIYMSILMFSSFTLTKRKTKLEKLLYLRNYERSYIFQPKFNLNLIWSLVSWHLLGQSQQCKNQNNVLNLFRINNKDTRASSVISFWCL